MAVICKHCVVDGRVQGVFYRSSTMGQANKLGLTGWVRNMADGGVEAVIQGEPDQVEAMIDWLHRGPEMAEVTGVQVRDMAPQELTSFRVVR